MVLKNNCSPYFEAYNGQTWVDGACEGIVACEHKVDEPKYDTFKNFIISC